jgi:CheY-like chemotaxis protein
MGFLKLFGSKDEAIPDKKDHQKKVMETFFSDKHKLIHDLKTPLNGISGMAQLLRETPLSSEQAEYIGVIEDSIRAMLEQIDRLSSGDTSVSPYVAVEIRSFLQQALGQMRETNMDNDVSIHYKIDSKFPYQLSIEESLLQECMLNIFKELFASQKRELLIEALYPSDEDYIVMVLRDKTLGFDDDLQYVDMDVFDEDLGQRIEGSSIRYNMMRTVDGKIRFELYANYDMTVMTKKSSEVSKELVNEITEIKETVTESYVTEIPQTDGQVILIAEDEVVGRVTLKLMLKDRFNVVFAKNGKEAVDLYFKIKPVLVLMDIMMPIMNGFEAFDEIERKDKNHVPIIACTSKVISTEREYLTSYGFDDHLDKPIDQEHLNRILEKYLTT